MFQFGSRPRLLEHSLGKSQLCGQYFMDFVANVPVEDLAHLEAIDRDVGKQNVRSGVRRNSGVAPCTRRCGPHPQLSRHFATRHTVGLGQRWHPPLLDIVE